MNNYYIGISADAVRILLHAGLMKRDEADGSPVITQAGFQFLLLETALQVLKFNYWFFFFILIVNQNYMYEIKKIL